MPNPFDFFDIPVAIQIDAKALRKKYLEIQRNMHPDMVLESNNMSEIANECYRVLSSHEGVVSAYLTAKGFLSNNENQLNADFLMEMMDFAEEIDEAINADFILRQSIEVRLNQIQSILDLEFENFKIQVDPQVSDLVIWYQKQRYLNRLRKNFDGIEEI